MRVAHSMLTRCERRTYYYTDCNGDVYTVTSYDDDWMTHAANSMVLYSCHMTLQVSSL